MSEGPAPPLLSHDKEMLDRVASPLREGRGGFSVLVCPPDLWPAATGYLRERSGKDVPAPRRIRSGDEMVALLARAEERPRAEVESFAVDDANEEVFTALNWNRDKVRRGAHVLAWLGSAEGLQTLVRHAPDAYSFRDYTLVLRGEVVPEEGWTGEEPPDIKTARLLFELPRSPEERAEAAVGLATALFQRGRAGEAMLAAAEGLALLPRERFSSPRHRRARIALLHWLATWAARKHRTVDVFRFCRAGSEECDALGGETANALWFELCAAEAPPLVGSPDLVDRCMEAFETFRGANLRLMILGSATSNAARRGRFSEALRRIEASFAAPGLGLDAKANLLWVRATTLLRAGRLDRAEADLDAAAEAYRRAGYSVPPTVSARAALLLDRGELAAAENVWSNRADAGAEDAGVSHVLEWFRTRGDVGVVVATVAERIRAALAVFEDRRVAEECVHLLRFLGGPRAHAIAGSELVRALELIDATGRALQDHARDDPPWYRVLFPAYRGLLLSLFDARQEEAIASASEAIRLSRSLWKGALSFTTRVLVQCLARADRWSTMGPAAREALEAARSADHRMELATVQAYEVVRLVRAAAPRASLESALSALQQTFSEMDAPRVEAETWLEVAPFLPPTATFPDAIVIADHAHGLFLDMPMPEMAARCMEWLGDIHGARGERDQAARCYRMSLGTLARYELFPRKPLVQEKLAAV